MCLNMSAIGLDLLARHALRRSQLEGRPTAVHVAPGTICRAAWATEPKPAKAAASKTHADRRAIGAGAFDNRCVDKLSHSFLRTSMLYIKLLLFIFPGSTSPESVHFSSRVDVPVFCRGILYWPRSCNKRNTRLPSAILSLSRKSISILPRHINLGLSPAAPAGFIWRWPLFPASKKTTARRPLATV